MALRKVTEALGHTTTKTVAIAAGASLSAEVDLEGFALFGLIMPAAWTAAGLTFQAAAASAGTFCNVYDDAGAEVAISADASRAIGIKGDDALALAPWRYLKIRSGTAAAAVNQADARTLTLILKG